MKQITLRKAMERPAPSSCAGRLLFIWGGYGIAIAWLWSLTPRDAGSQAAVWALALLAGVWLLLGMREA